MVQTSENKYPFREILVLFLCWIFWAVAQGYSWHNVAPRVLVSVIIKVRSAQLVCAFLFNLVFVAYVYKVNRRNTDNPVYYLLLFVGLAVISYLLVFCNTSLFNYLRGKPVNFKGMAEYTAFALAKFIFLGGFTTLFFLLKNDRKYKTQQQKIEEARQLARDARLIMLQYQLNPHFLFNALNSIRALVNENGEKAREMITELSEFLRSVLVYNENTTTTIKHEIQVVKNYLKIQHIRFSNDMNYSFNIDEELLDVEVPCFILQPMVENSIKYGMKTSELPLKIKVEIKKKNDLLSISVINTGHLVKNDSDDNKNNKGISNIINRLELYYGKKGTFSLQEESGKVSAVIAINGKL